MDFVGTVLIYAGLVALLVGYFWIVFCGFAEGIRRGIRNLILPVLGFGDAMRRFHFLIWLWGGDIAAIVIGALFT
jgi:hypothetical protein